MMLFGIILLFIAGVTCLTTAKVSACTGVYVGKKASADGTTIVGRSEDQANGAYNKRFYVRPRTVESGRTYVDTGEGQEGFSVPLPETTYKYTYIPDSSDAGDGEYPACSMNEYGLTVVATVTAAAKDEYLELDPYINPGLREAILAGLLAGQCKTAREAVDNLAEMMKIYGSSEGNILFFVDQQESWIFECYGGHGYAAMQMPEDKVAVFGNNFMIETIEREDKENFVVSDNLFDVMDRLGPVIEDGKYNIAKTISVNPREEYSNMRTWIGHKILAPSTVGAYSNEIFYPLFYSPDNKVSVETVMDIFRNRYEETIYDMNVPENRGRRPIGVTRTGEVHIVQTFDNLPKDSCHLQWLALGNAEHSVFVPAFGGITETYEAYHVDGSRYDDSSMYSASKRICAIAETDREFLSQGTKDFWKIQEQLMIKEMNGEISKVDNAYKESIEEGRAYVTNLAEYYAEKQFRNSKLLFDDLFWRMTANADDRIDNQKKQHFVTETEVAEWTKLSDYELSERDNTTYSLKKDDKEYILEIGNKRCIVKQGEEEYEIMLSLATTKYNEKLYAPIDFLMDLQGGK